MTDFFFQMGLSNACLSLALAIVAMVVGAKARRPHLAHMLWLLVFIKLVTPPIVTIPIVTIPAEGETAVAINDISRPIPPISNSHQPSIDEQPDASLWSKFGSTTWNHTRVWLPPIWLLGSVVVFGWSMVRVFRFSRLLAVESEVAPQELQTAAEKTAHRLGLKTIPTICTTSARISPMVWWTGGKVRIVIPTAMLDQMDAQKWHWVLAHEMAHVRRRDYLVRWLEWLACVLFWWNPVVWWAQRNLRAMEEICCDDLVISSLNPKPKIYANSLLSAVEFLARPVLRPPAMASEINSGGFLERRFKMIVSNKSKPSNSRWLQICVLLFAIVVLPFGIASAQDYEAVERRLGEGVAKGELTLKQAGIMLDALKKAGGARKDQGVDRAEAYLMRVKKELGEFIEAGKISKEDAAKRYEGTEKAIKERMAAGRRERQRGDDKQRQYEGFERRIKAAVREGKMTREEAGEQLEGFRRRMEMAERSERGERRITVEDYARAEAKLKKLVDEGKISEEDLRARLGGMRRMMGGQAERQRGGERQRTTRGDKSDAYEGFERRIKAAVEAGRMTREEAGEKLKGFRRRLEMAEQGERGERRISREDYARAEAELKKLVAEGKISEEDLRARLNGMRKMMAEQGRRQPGGERGDRERPDWEGIKRRIEGAVKSGDMTREEADAKYKEIRERLGRTAREKGAKNKDED